MRTLGQAIEQYAIADPSRPALVALQKNPLCYGELHKQIQRIRAQLCGAGLDSRCRIGLALLNGPEAIVMLAALACHAAVIPVNEDLTTVQLRELFQQIGLHALVMGQSQSSIRKVARELKLPVLEARTRGGPDIECSLHVSPESRPQQADPEPDSVALILQTSGTTGRSKLVPITHNNLYWEAVKLREWFDLTPDDRCLSFLPLCYAHGLREITFPPLFTGGSIARPGKHDEADILTWLLGLQPTWYSAFPVHHAAILKALQRAPNGGMRHRLRFVLSSGTPLREEVQQDLSKALGAPVLEFYGIGEAGHMTANRPVPGQRKPGTCGLPIPGELMIGRDGLALPSGQIGEIHVRGRTITPGYLNDPEENRTAFLEGWFRTGDLGVLDADGFLSLRGRMKDLINRGGEKVAPLEVEQTLMRHPAVVEAAVFGIAHPSLGEKVAAAVVLRPGEKVLPAALRRFVRDRIASFKVPDNIAIIPELPKDVTGKLRRRQLAGIVQTHRAAHLSSAVKYPPDCPLAADLIQLWEELLQREDIGLDDDFFELGGDSFLALQLLLEIEKLTGLKVPDITLMEFPTVRTLAQALIQNRHSETKPVVHFGSLQAPPLFFFHGDLISGGYYVRKLARLLGEETAVVSIAPHGTYGEQIPSSIERMARERLPLILRAQPVGPFRLGGHCNGGMVALEVARLLQSAGHRVELLALVDSPSANAGLLMGLARRALGAALSLLPPEQRNELLAQSMVALWRVSDAPRRVWREPAAELAKIAATLKSCFMFFSRTEDESNRAIWQTYYRAMATYFPAPLEIPIVHYSAEHTGRYFKRISSQVAAIKLPGSHLECITRNVHRVAEDLRKRLETYRAHCEQVRA